MEIGDWRCNLCQAAIQTDAGCCPVPRCRQKLKMITKERSGKEEQTEKIKQLAEKLWWEEMRSEREKDEESKCFSLDKGWHRERGGWRDCHCLVAVLVRSTYKPQLGFVEPTPEEITFWTNESSNYPQQEMKSRGSTGQSESTAQSIRPLCQLWYKIIPWHMHPQDNYSRSTSWKIQVLCEVQRY